MGRFAWGYASGGGLPAPNSPLRTGVTTLVEAHTAGKVQAGKAQTEPLRIAPARVPRCVLRSIHRAVRVWSLCRTLTKPAKLQPILRPITASAGKGKTARLTSLSVRLRLLLPKSGRVGTFRATLMAKQQRLPHTAAYAPVQATPAWLRSSTIKLA